LLPIEKLFFLCGNIGRARREETKDNSCQKDLLDQKKPPYRTNVWNPADNPAPPKNGPPLASHY
jgi:hypothetical protein